METEELLLLSGLNWVFSEVEEAFFCQSLLSLYRDDERIMHIGGNNFQEYSMTPYSYFFSKYTHIWGWATWRNGLSIYPNKNLISNIGFSPDALNTRNIHSPLANVPTFDIWELKHPPFMVRHQAADTYTFDYVFGGKNMKKPKTFKDKISSFFSNNKRRVRRLFNDPIGFISSVRRKFISHN